MGSRTLKNLILTNEDYIFEGNLTIKGDVIIKNGNLSVSGTLNFSKENATISIIGGNISAKKLLTSAPITIRDGDISVVYLHATADIDSDGDIEVKSKSFAQNIKCMNYLASANNYSSDITAVQDVYILGISDSGDIKARDVLIDCGADFNGCGVVAKCFECGGDIFNCSYMTIG